jgi:hypothetical protein
LLRAANATKARPAMIPIEPPNAAEIAPCIPASQADSRLTAAVHKTCSPITGRKTCHTNSTPLQNRRILRETRTTRQHAAVQYLTLRSEIFAKPGDQIG